MLSFSLIVKFRVIIDSGNIVRSARMCLLYWEAIRWGCDSQFVTFDFGRSTKGEGTYKFKMQWGSVEEPLHWQRFSATVQNGTVQTEKDKYAWVASLWSHLPVPVTKIIGPWIRKQVSL